MGYSLKDKVAMVTGGADGIGEAIVRMLLDEEVKHVAILDVAEAKGQALRDELNSKKRQYASYIKCDVTNEDQLTAAYKAVVDQNGYVDLVINNAGILDEKSDMYMKEIAVNFTAVISSSLKARQLMRADNGGRGGTIVNIASTAALVHFPQLPIYGATKAGVLHFSISLGMELSYSRTKVRMLAICFGKTMSNMVKCKTYNCIDKEFEDSIHACMDGYEEQTVESAAKGVIEAYKQGNSGTAWLVARSCPAKDVTDVLRNTFNVLQNEI